MLRCLLVIGVNIDCYTISLSIIKFGQPFSKVVGVGKAHKTFILHKIMIAKQLAVLRLKHNGKSLLIGDSTAKVVLLY